MRRLVLAAGLAVGVVLVNAAPAAAHTVGGEHATNYRTRVRVVVPAVRGIALRAIEHGDRLQLTNATARDVVVLGYDGEPYLRVGPRGVFENTRSPATYLNRTRLGTDTPPKSADPSASPEWRRVSGGTTARWHDHRAHWMSTTEPPPVQRAPQDPHLIQRFTITLHTGGEVLRGRGDVWWVPPPSPWPWVALALGFGVAIVVLARTRWSVWCMGGALGIVLLATAVHAVGAWSFSVRSPVTRLADTLPTLGALALGVIAEIQLFRRGVARGRAAPRVRGPVRGHRDRTRRLLGSVAFAVADRSVVLARPPHGRARARRRLRHCPGSRVPRRCADGATGRATAGQECPRRVQRAQLDRPLSPRIRHGRDELLGEDGRRVVCACGRRAHPRCAGRARHRGSARPHPGRESRAPRSRTRTCAHGSHGRRAGAGHGVHLGDRPGDRDRVRRRGRPGGGARPRSRPRGRDRGRGARGRAGRGRRGLVPGRRPHRARTPATQLVADTVGRARRPHGAGEQRGGCAARDATRSSARWTPRIGKRRCA